MGATPPLFRRLKIGKKQKAAVRGGEVSVLQLNTSCSTVLNYGTL